MNRKLSFGLLSMLVVLSIYIAVKKTGLSDKSSIAGSQRILVSTFPIYQIVRNVVEGRPGLDVELMLPSQMGCPHDYVLTPQDMEKLVKADVLVINGLGLEEFLGAPLKKANPTIKVIDSSSGIEGTLQLSEINSDFINSAEHEYKDADKPYEWRGVFNLDSGAYKWSFSKVGNQYADAAMKMFYLEAKFNTTIELNEAKAQAEFKEKSLDLRHEDKLLSGRLAKLHFDETKKQTEFEIIIDKPGTYVFLQNIVHTNLKPRNIT